MIDMGMRQENILDHGSANRHFSHLIVVFTLFHAAVHQKKAARLPFDERPAPGNLMRCSDKCDFHIVFSLFSKGIDFRSSVPYNGLQAVLPRILAIRIIAEFDPVDGDPAVFSVSVHAFHAVITDLFRVKIAAVAFAAADTFPVVQNAWMIHTHSLPVDSDYTTAGKKRSSEPPTHSEKVAERGGMNMANITLKAGREKRVYSRHPWIFRSDIDHTDDQITPGDIVSVLSSKGRFLAKAFYNPQSQIALRVMSYADEPIDRAFIFRRVHEAVEYRKTFADLHSCRLIFAESDRLPALIVDSFGGVLVLQCLALGMERFKQDIVDALVEEMHPTGIWERNDVPVRRLEGLEMTTGLLYGEVPDLVEICENGVHFYVDVKEGQKTGFFLDQKENRAAIAPFVKDKRVLDCFTHTGSFALHAGYYGAKEVTGVDISGFACRFAEKNAILNHLEDRVHFVEANAFDLLAEKSRIGKQYDVIILDPPAFTKTKAMIDNAIRGYKEINLRALKMIAPGGYLITCSCSQHVLPQMFRNMVLDAANDARVVLRQIEFRTQGRDHPILPAAQETEYLKCGIYQVFPL